MSGLVSEPVDSAADGLPAGYRCRPAELDDAETILALVAAYNTPLVGFADCTLDDIRDELVEPGFDRERNSWLVFGDADRPVGYGWTFGDGNSDQIDVEAIAVDPVVAGWLLDRVSDRAREVGREHGYDTITVSKGIYREDDPMRAHLEARGFEPATTFQRMRIDHTGPVPFPEPPPGVRVREAADDAIRRAAHDVQARAFSDHFGWVRKPYEEWLETHEARSNFDWSQLWLVELDGRPVAICECTDQFVEDEDCGYVSSLGVLAEARGRGIAKYLLRRVFAADAAAGRTGTILHVDANNTTPAVGLYASVGMRSVLIIDVWRRELSSGA